MFPILYENITAGTVPQDYGLGVLSDCVSCEAEQVKNGIYELVMEYPATGLHAQDLADRRVIKVKANRADEPQLFRIDRIGKVMNGKITVYAKHISYDLSGYILTSGSAINSGGAARMFQKAANLAVGIENAYSITTRKEVTADMLITTPASIKSYFVGREGSFADIYGQTEVKYNNFSVSLLTHAGVTEPRVTIRYGKNLLELSQELDSSNLYTHVICYYKSEGASIVGNKVATGLVLDVPKTILVDVSSEYQTTPSIADLTTRAYAYATQNNLTVPSNNITLDFVQSQELSDRVDLCDVVNVYYEALGISATAKCIRTKWDCLRERYIETEFGDIKTDLADTITNNTAAVADAKSSADAAVNLVGSKKRVFISTPVPPYDVGDLWTEDGVMYYCTTAKQTTIIKETEEAAVASFDALINDDLIEFRCEIEASEEGFSTLVISVADENMDVQKVYAIDLEENLTQGGEFRVFYDIVGGQVVQKAVLTRTDTTEKEYDITQIAIPETIVGHNNIFCNTGDIAVKYYETGFSKTDWDVATDYVNDSELENAITHSSQLITGGLGGNVILQTDEDGRPYEIVIFKTEHAEDPQDLEHAKYVWRWNSGGLGYSDEGYDSLNYKLALDSEGHINASMITAGELNAIQAGLQNITASMFAGQMIQLGGEDMPYGKLVILDQSNNTLIQMDINGLECFGETVGGITPSVVFDKNGVTAYSNSNDKANSKIFWTHEEEFCMKNSIIENQLELGEMVKFLPFTIKDSNNNVINQGIAVVPLTKEN